MYMFFRNGMFLEGPIGEIENAIKAITADYDNVALFGALENALRNTNVSDLNNKRLKGLQAVAEFLPPHIKKFDISSNSLGTCSFEEVKKLFKNLADKNVTHLSFGNNSFSGDQLKELFKLIPKSVTHIDLQYSTLCDAPRDIYNTLPANVISVDLRNNYLGDEFLYPRAETVRYVADFSAPLNNSLAKYTKLKTLDLTGSEIQKLEIAKDFFKAVSGNLDYLILSGLKFHDDQRKVANFARICQLIPYSVTRLDLSNNDLRPIKNSDYLRKGLANLPYVISELNLTGCNLIKFDDASLKYLQESLSGVATTQIKTIYFDELAPETSSKDLAKLFKALEDHPDIQFGFGDAKPQTLQSLQAEVDKRRTQETKQGLIDGKKAADEAAVAADAAQKISEAEAKEKALEAQGAANYQILSKSGFNDSFARISDKRFTLNGPAYRALMTLVGKLETARDAFGRTGDGKALQTDCLAALSEATPELEKHRGWKEVFAQICSVLVSVITLGTANLIKQAGPLSLFAVKTDTIEKMDVMRDNLKSIEPPAP